MIKFLTVEVVQSLHSAWQHVVNLEKGGGVFLLILLFFFLFLGGCFFVGMGVGGCVRIHLFYVVWREERSL